MEEGGADFLSIGNVINLSSDDELAGIAQLATHFGISGRGVEHDRGFVLHGHDLDDAGVGGEMVETGEAGGLFGFDF